MRLQTLTLLVTALAFTNATSAMTMQELFDAVNANGNISSSAALRGQTMNLYTGGSLFMRMPQRTYNLASYTPPSWSAGCGGIDLFMGGFSFINKEQFVAMLRNIGSNALGYGFKLAIQNLCPTCDNVMQALQTTAQHINRQNIDSCDAAVGLVNAAVPDTWTRGKQNAAKNFGVDTNIFGDISDAWTGVMSSEERTNETIEEVAEAKPEVKDKLPTGNVTWKALKKVNGLTDEYRMILMSMFGSVIYPTNSTQAQAPQDLMPKDITVETLVGLQSETSTIELPIWKCQTTSADGCLNPKEDGVVETKSFKTLVHEKMQLIADKIADRSDYEDLTDVLAFINSTDIPVYKMLAVNTRYGDSSQADTVINKYEELIAAKYAEVYIQRAVRDTRAAIAQFAELVDAAQARALKELEPRLDRKAREARHVVERAHSQTVSAYAIAQEIQQMERAMNASLSQTLRNSLTFAKSLH